MQVKAISAPVEALVSQFEAKSFFLADGPSMASATHGRDFVDQPLAGPQASVWAALPLGRDVLLAATMVDRSGMDQAELARLTDDEVRESVLSNLLGYGRFGINDVLESADFQSGYRTDTERAEFFGLLASRIDTAFGYDGPRHEDHDIDVDA